MSMHIVLKIVSVVKNFSLIKGV